MTTYKVINAWYVIDEIKKGNKVYMLDRQNQSVALINDMDAQSAISIIEAKDEAKRYSFWTCEEVGEIEENE